MDSLIALISGLDSGWVIYLAIFFLLLICGFGVPIPEDISLFAAGLACYYGQTHVEIMIPVTMAGVMIGDSVMYGLGSRLGINVIKHRLFSKVIKPEHLEQVSGMLKKRGNLIFFFARFMPGIRTAVFFSAGALKVPFRTFFLFDGLAALISVPLIVYTSYYFGDRIHEVIQLIRKTNTGLLGAIIVIALIISLKLWMKKRRAQRPLS